MVRLRWHARQAKFLHLFNFLSDTRQCATVAEWRATARNRMRMSYTFGKSDGVEKAPAKPASPRLIDEVRRRLRLKHYSLRTE
jgi:hypothetical protein